MTAALTTDDIVRVYRWLNEEPRSSDIALIEAGGSTIRALRDHLRDTILMGTPEMSVDMIIEIALARHGDGADHG